MSPASATSNRSSGVIWRESTQASPTKLAEYIHFLELACQKNPHSADLHTCLAIAQATNSYTYQALDSFESAIRLDGRHFFARFKYAEVLFRLGFLGSAEEETRKAVELARSAWEFSMTRRLLQQIWNH